MRVAYLWRGVMVGSLGSREELDEEKLEAFVWSLDQARITRWASAVGKMGIGGGQEGH